MKIILLGNYPKDKQESMERFALMLQTGFHDKRWVTEIWRPKVLLGKWFESTNSGLGKWFGYIDKWVLFPIILRKRLIVSSVLGQNLRFHVCDHSNAPYLQYLPKDQTAITCHDVLAIRGALGFQDAYCQASAAGEILQKYILNHLSKAKYLASVSHLTLNQLKALTIGKFSPDQKWKVIHNAFNGAFFPMEKEKIDIILNASGVSQQKPFILHVGSNLERKNRKMLLDMVAYLGDRWDGNICFAGKGADQSLLDHAQTLGIQDRVFSIIKPDHATLVALYNACDVFVFPSFSEGFGWPVIEAQACGVPVIASDIEPMPEVSGGAALHADPSNPKEFADAFLRLKNPVIREELIRNGFDNSKRYQPNQMINAYLELFGMQSNEKTPLVCS